MNNRSHQDQSSTHILTGTDRHSDPGNGQGFVDTIIIGGGQAGLSMGYQLSRNGIPFLILDANERVGDAWRQRWDSLRLFTPARYCGLAGMRFPGSRHKFPTKDEMADFLEHYARHFNLPVLNNTRVRRLYKKGDRFIVETGNGHFEAGNVVVAMSNYQYPRIPSFANDLDPGITQIHSKEYRGPRQLQDGDVLIVGAGNSGADIGIDVARTHRTFLAGRDTGHVPFRIETLIARLLLVPIVLRLMFHKVMTINTPMGRMMRKKIFSQGGALVRVKPRDLTNAGIKRVPRVMDVENGMPRLEDGRVLDVKSVIWCTGYQPGFSWIELPVLGEHEPLHERGIVPTEPGLYFVGLHFLFAASSSMMQGLERDCRHIVKHLVSRSRKMNRAVTAELPVMDQQHMAGSVA